MFSHTGNCVCKLGYEFSLVMERSINRIHGAGAVTTNTLYRCRSVILAALAAPSPAEKSAKIRAFIDPREHIEFAWSSRTLHALILHFASRPEVAALTDDQQKATRIRELGSDLMDKEIFERDFVLVS